MEGVERRVRPGLRSRLPLWGGAAGRVSLKNMGSESLFEVQSGVPNLYPGTCPGRVLADSEFPFRNSGVPNLYPGTCPGRVIAVSESAFRLSGVPNLYPGTCPGRVLADSESRFVEVIVVCPISTQGHALGELSQTQSSLFRI